MTHHPTPQPTPPNPNTQGLAVAPSLTVLSDQPERWTAHGKNPLTWDAAREAVAAADRADGVHSDFTLGDLSTCVVMPRATARETLAEMRRRGVADVDTLASGEANTATLVTVPVPGRPVKAFPMRKAAFRQLAGALGAPADYLLGLPAKLATACVSTGLARLDRKNTSKFIRLADGEARAIASDRYAPLDNDLVLDTTERTLRALGMLRDCRVTDLAVGPTLSMRIVLPGEAKPVRVGDVIQHGLDVLNGEVLNRSVSIAPVTYRLVCLNGMRRWENGIAKRWTHVGDPDRLRQAFTDYVPVALAEAQGLRDRMAVAVDRLVDDALGEIEGLSAFGFGVGETRAIARDLFATRGLALPTATDEWRDAIQGAAPVTVYDVANAITHVAQTREHTDDRLAYEEAGGSYLYRRTR